MFNGLLAFRFKAGALADTVLGLGMSYQQMDHQAVDTTSGDSPAFKAMVLMACVGFDFDTFEITETPADAVSVVIADPSTLDCLGDAAIFVNEGVTIGTPYNSLLAFQYKSGDNADLVLGFGSLAKQMQHAAVNNTSGTAPAFKAMLLVSWVGYDYETDTVSPTPADQVCVTIEDPDDLNCHGDAAEFIGIAGGGGGGPAYSEGTFNVTFDNSIGVVAVSYRKIGNWVSLELPETINTLSNAHIVAAAGQIPAAYRPVQGYLKAQNVFNNGAQALGRVDVFSNGGMVFGSNSSGLVFTAGTGGFLDTSISYQTAIA